MGLKNEQDLFIHKKGKAAFRQLSLFIFNSLF